ncbi:MAG: DUF2251 domain-containing protein [Verrucomicrobia bacterium]|nr:MAG: DUF2251 domain-containing protein [Verrucomicrobiota bacterium]
MSSPEKQSSEPVLGAKQEVLVGCPTVVETSSPDGRFGVVFEDDEQTGYFYARDFTVDAADISDALHIYSVEGVTDRHIPSEVHILWSRDSTKACLIINRYPHAVFDFTAKRGYSRDVFPEPSPGWTHHPWDDSVRGNFFS